MAKTNEPVRVQSDPLVDRVVGDPHNPRSNRLLRGYVGTSPKDGFVRLYLDAQFKTRVEIPQDAILGTKVLASGISPLELTYIWASADAELQWHPAVGRRAPITVVDCPPQTIHTDCPTPSFNLPCQTQGCPPPPTEDCPAPTDFCYGSQYPRVTLNCPPITESGCAPQTIHTDCPTPSFNLPCQTQGCPPPPTEDCPAPTDFCYSYGRRRYPQWMSYGARPSRSRPRYRRIW